MLAGVNAQNCRTVAVATLCHQRGPAATPDSRHGLSPMWAACRHDPGIPDRGAGEKLFAEIAKSMHDVDA